jgi:hypothetical protein
LIALFVTALPPVQQVTLRIPLQSGPQPEEIAVVTFDAASTDNAHAACYQIFIRWHTCANHEMAKRLGSYPKEKWKAFLDAFGIQERLESTVD